MDSVGNRKNIEFNGEVVDFHRKMWEKPLLKFKMVILNNLNLVYGKLLMVNIYLVRLYGKL